MEEKKEVSIFDSGINTHQVTRSNTRRNAVIIPLKKGKELANMIAMQMEKETTEENNKMEDEWRQAWFTLTSFIWLIVTKQAHDRYF